MTTNNPKMHIHAYTLEGLKTQIKLNLDLRCPNHATMWNKIDNFTSRYTDEHTGLFYESADLKQYYSDLGNIIEELRSFITVESHDPEIIPECEEALHYLGIHLDVLRALHDDKITECEFKIKGYG